MRSFAVSTAAITTQNKQSSDALFTYLFYLLGVQVVAPSGNRDQRFAVHGARGQAGVDRKWGAAAESQNPQNRFAHNRAPIPPLPQTPSGGRNWRRASSGPEAATVSHKFDFSMPDWDALSSDDDESARTLQAAPAAYEFNLSQSD